MCHAKYFFNSASPKTRATSTLRMRSRNTTRLMPPFTRTDGHNMPATPEFLAARPNAWHIVSKPLSLIFVKFSRIQLDNLSHAGRSATVRSSTDESAHSIPHVIRGFKSSGASWKSAASWNASSTAVPGRVLEYTAAKAPGAFQRPPAFRLPSPLSTYAGEA